MVVVCKGIINCPYVSPNGFCRRRVTSIFMGRCEYLTMKELGKEEEPLYFNGYKKSYMEQERDEALERLTGVFSLIAKQKEGK